MTEYVATRPIVVGNALGYAPGDLVSADVVKDLGLETGVDVAKATPKAVEKAASTDTVSPPPVTVTPKK